MSDLDTTRGGRAADGPPEVWVTGMAWSTPLGTGLDEVWRSLLDGGSGIQAVPSAPSAHPLRNESAAVLPGLSLDKDPGERLHILSRDTLADAVADAGLDVTDPRLRAVFGTSYGPHLDTTGVTALDDWCADVTGELNMPQAPVSLTTACSSGSDSLLVGAELIRNGDAEICVCGAADILTPAKRLGHSALGTMSPTSLRAFDEAHDGTILGEGAAFLVLESARSATARGARPRGYLLGAGSANDAVNTAAPDLSGDSVVRAVGRALLAAGRHAEDVVVVNAHGSGTPVNDLVECRSYERVFSTAGSTATSPTVFATKGAFGHTLGATGALEAVTVLLALRDGVVPPVHGLTTVMPGFPLPLPMGGPAAFDGRIDRIDRIGLSVTLGFGGFNTCLAFEGTR
ncbi:beta-ketoacyl-[acyl-carrier-protein] synthase family protein [Streptosporangium sp. NBC_01469]|uniref:beta-ketoacyl-[acyl-carrier-protein] synthase family protein n=1 Tax=Streptosporangium sp. NBC_01469 TaxID=2903898 RepID=UPI002E2C3B38|nr:beta-ketoacyl-[acyl-carrier-protein] synthase family protein [Streptosporangium sp. NBC_01469]